MISGAYAIVACTGVSVPNCTNVFIRKLEFALTENERTWTLHPPSFRQSSKILIQRRDQSADCEETLSLRTAMRIGRVSTTPFSSTCVSFHAVASTREADEA